MRSGSSTQDGTSPPSRQASSPHTDAKAEKVVQLSSLDVWAQHVAQFAVQQQHSVPAHSIVAMLSELGVPAAALAVVCTQLLTAQALSTDARFALLPEMSRVQAAQQLAQAPVVAGQPAQAQLVQNRGLQSPAVAALRRRKSAAQWVAMGSAALSVVAPVRLARLLLAAPVAWCLSQQACVAHSSEHGFESAGAGREAYR